MRPETDGDFEIHLTARPDADLVVIAARHALKTTFIELDRGEHPLQPMLTYHASGAESAVVAEAHRVAGRLAADGLPVVRIKVEAHAANPGLPQAGPDGAEDHSDGYFEGHLRVAVDPGRLAELRALAIRHGAHLSQNPHKISGLERRFVTARAHSVGAPEACRRFDLVKAALEAAGFVVDKVEHEYVVHDTCFELDRGWLPVQREATAAAPGARTVGAPCHDARMADLTPLKLFSTSPGSFSLILSDARMVDVADLFEAAGQSGHGYDWESIAKTVVRLDAPALAGRFRCDPEAGMFSAYGPDEAALAALGELLCAAFHDRERLAALIAAVDPGDWD